jgi:hypothetical protein
MIQLRIFTQGDPEPAALIFAESEEPQIQLELADGTRIRLAHFAEGRAEIMVSGLLGDEVHIRPRSNVFDVVTAPGPQVTRDRSPNGRGEE